MRGRGGRTPVAPVTALTPGASTHICQGMSWQHLHQPCVAGKV